MKLRKTLATLIGLGFLFSSCTEGIQVFIAPGSTTADLVFGFSESGGEDKFTITSVDVVTCDEASRLWKGGATADKPPEYVWSARAVDSLTSRPTDRFTYGKAEHGLRATSGPEPIAVPGCYVARVYVKGRHGETRGGVITFKAEEGGKVRKSRQPKRGWLL